LDFETSISTGGTTPPSPIAASADLAAAFVDGQAWAFEAAYHEFKRLLLATAMQVLIDGEEAQDCVHDVFARLWRRGNAYSAARGSLRSFLVVCVRNEALSRRRKYSNRSRIEHETLRPDLAEPADESLADRDLISRALQSLGEKQREAVRLAYDEGLTQLEIAQRLNEPLGTIKSRLSNAVRALRAQFLAQGELR
jgi:RNA polymerase sigma-70 factor (ECF subfamily)